ncbi:hypothetical protein ACFU98_10625 [Streptomyces sp. NPDC057575]|uniref:hypothetical protein n=1 Tax=unclassified Streptomyces TaxID=2593676 RepID=UPI0036979B1D
MFIPWTSSLIAAADPATVAVADDGTWTGTIALVNEWSADQRMLTLDEGAEIEVRPLPLPVTVQYITGPGHDGATVGLMTLDEVWQDEHRVMGRGRIDLDDPQGAALARKIERGFLRFVSADVDKVDGRVVCVDADGQPVDGCDPADSGMDAGELYTRWRIMGASLLAHPAFPEAQIGMAAAALAVDDEELLEDTDDQDEPSACVRMDDETGTWVLADCDEDGAVPANADGDGPLETGEAEAVVAAAFRHDNWLPPTEWFRDPKLAEPTKVHVTEDGRIIGHLALWGVPHVSYQGRKIFAPKSPTAYERFHTRPIHTSEGLVEVGALAMDTDHARHGAPAKQAVKHYETTGSIAGAVRCGEDTYGIWVSGALLPDITDDQRLRLSLADYSGDWRDEGHGLDLKAALAVPAGHEGFYTPKSRVLNREDYALVASGGVTEEHIAMARSAVPAGVVPPVLAQVDVAVLADAVLAEQGRRIRVGAAATRVRSLRVAAAHRRLGTTRTAALAADGELANWVDQQGGLPAYIKRIAKHLTEKGMDESQAIATAVNAAKKMCATGDLNFPGKQDVNPGSRAEACKAVAEWEAKKAAARAT